jgi:hypothetical protein
MNAEMEYTFRHPQAGEMFSEIRSSFKEAGMAEDLNERIRSARAIFHSVAELEEDVYTELSKNIKMTGERSEYFQALMQAVSASPAIAAKDLA